MKFKAFAAAAALVASSGAFAVNVFIGPQTIGDHDGGKKAETFTETFDFQLGKGSNLTLTFSNLTFSGPMHGSSITLDLFKFGGLVPVASKTFSLGSSVSFAGLTAAKGKDYFLYSTAARDKTTQGAQASWSAQVSMVPEPQTYALMLAGLGAVGFIARRRRPQA